jgi:hypothetical protein
MSYAPKWEQQEIELPPGNRSVPQFYAQFIFYSLTFIRSSLYKIIQRMSHIFLHAKYLVPEWRMIMNALRKRRIHYTPSFIAVTL